MRTLLVQEDVLKGPFLQFSLDVSLLTISSRSNRGEGRTGTWAIQVPSFQVVRAKVNFRFMSA